MMEKVLYGDVMSSDFNKRKQTIYNFICDSLYVPMKLKEMAIVLNIPKEERDSLREVLDSLIADGKISVSKRGKYAKAEKVRLEGIFTSNARGFGFVTVDGMERDIFISPDDCGGAMQDDKVVVQIKKPEKKNKRAEGVVVKVLERGMDKVIGRFEDNGGFGFVISDNPKFTKDVFISGENVNGAKKNQKVVCKILSYGDEKKKPEGEIIEVLGDEGEAGVDILSIIRAFGLPEEFEPDVEKLAKKIAIPLTEEDVAGRLDLRDEIMFTIDGEDAKDLDDAVSLKIEGDSYILGVHIADVSNYVKEGSVLDEEALQRGTSVYLVDRVIPMLPRELSNGMCSLNAGEDRFALSCIMEIDKKGNVTGHKIAETVINVNKRMNYTDVWKVLNGSEDAPEDYEPYREILLSMNELAKILREKRMARGSIDFDFPETYIKLNEKGVPVKVGPYERNGAHKLIEDFMLIANETVAEDSFWQEIPFVYRSHGTPDPEKIRALAMFINNFGYHIHMKDDDIHPKELQKLLANVEGSDEEALIARLCLKSMQRARYTTDAKGHFGLAAKYYCHFTSPIRRYPDLQIHRIIKENIKGQLNEKRREHYAEILDEVAKLSSVRERVADDAERETDKLKKCEYMTRHIGKEYDGVISSVTAFGFFVELMNTVEGLVHISALYDDDYVYDADKMELDAVHYNKCYKLGQKVKIKVKAADVRMRTVDFVLVDE